MIDIEATGKEIKRRMHEKHMNVKQFADKCIVSEQAVYRWIQGKKLINTENLLNISKVLECKMDDLIKEQEE